MKRLLFVLSAAVMLASSSGCCCGERLFNWGCCKGGCPYGGQYGGDCCDTCGSAGGGCSDCYASRGRGRGHGGAVMYDEGMAGGGMDAGPQALVDNHPADGHPLVRRRRNAGGEYEFAAGPPTGGVTYPYYTNRGPRDFLARTPRDIGP